MVQTSGTSRASRSMSIDSIRSESVTFTLRHWYCRGSFGPPNVETSTFSVLVQDRRSCCNMSLWMNVRWLPVSSSSSPPVRNSQTVTVWSNTNHERVLLAGAIVKRLSHCEATSWSSVALNCGVSVPHSPQISQKSRDIHIWSIGRT